MGIVNVTPDSFSDGGRFLDPEKALEHALRLQEEGADLIDIGAESTRPRSLAVTEEEELSRVLPALRKIIPRLKIPVSIDTQKTAVAKAAFDEGAALLNDVSALKSPGMAAITAKYEKPVILMHMRGEPETMQENPVYENVCREVAAFLESRIEFAVNHGIPRDQILIDPGLGFGKRFEDNLTLLNLLSTFRSLQAPIVVGASRKSFLKKIFGEEEASLLAGNAAASVIAASRGASILRVHDVAVTKAAIRLAMRNTVL